jgi:hypothetical protein
MINHRNSNISSDFMLVSSIVVVFATNASNFTVKLRTKNKKRKKYTTFDIKKDVDIYGLLKNGDKHQQLINHFQGEYNFRFKDITSEFQFYRKEKNKSEDKSAGRKSSEGDRCQRR